jgi:ribose 5-phosphate isomerase B
VSDVLYLGADHAGFEMKEHLKHYLKKSGYIVKDLGAWRYVKSDDYPDYAIPVAKLVVKTGGQGILVCGSAEGICIAANKVKGARAVPVWSLKNAALSRKHNDANILCLAGGKTVEKTHGLGLSLAQAKRIVDTWLATPFSGEARHVRRIKKIERYEREAR